MQYVWPFECMIGGNNEKLRLLNSKSPFFLKRFHIHYIISIAVIVNSIKLNNTNENIIYTIGIWS